MYLRSSSPDAGKEPQNGVVVGGLHGRDGVQPDAFVGAVQPDVIDTEPGSGSDSQAREVVADVGRTGNLYLFEEVCGGALAKDGVVRISTFSMQGRE
jgi:hypothetical protein